MESQYWFWFLANDDWQRFYERSYAHPEALTHLQEVVDIYK